MGPCEMDLAVRADDQVGHGPPCVGSICGMADDIADGVQRPDGDEPARVTPEHACLTVGSDRDLHGPPAAERPIRGMRKDRARAINCPDRDGATRVLPEEARQLRAPPVQAEGTISTGPPFHRHEVDGSRQRLENNSSATRQRGTGHRDKIGKSDWGLRGCVDVIVTTRRIDARTRRMENKTFRRGSDELEPYGRHVRPAGLAGLLSWLPTCCH